MLETMYTYNYALVIGIEEAVPSSANSAVKVPVVRIFPPLTTVLNTSILFLFISLSTFYYLK